MIDSILVWGNNIITLNDLVTDKKNFYKIYTFGFNCPTREINESKVEAHGVDDYDAYLDIGQNLIEGKIVAESRSKLYEMKETLQAAFSPELYSYEYLKFTEPGRSAKQVSARSLGIVFLTEQRNQGKNIQFKIQLKIKDPYIYSQAQYSASFTFSIGAQVGYPFYYPVYYGSGTATTTTSCDNGGSVVSYPTITINGPITGPYIQNTTTGDILSFSNGLDLAVGDTLTIDMKEKTVFKTSSGTSTNVYQYKTTATDFFGLDPGNNNIQLGGITTDSSGGGNISWCSSWPL